MLADFIKVYDVLDNEYCRGIINLFEHNEKNHVRNDNMVQCFTEWNLSQYCPDSVQFGFSEILMTALDRYKADVPECRYFPEQLALEEFRVKRYVADTGEQFNWHVDVGDNVSSKRYLSFLFYLNDNFEGGETIFDGTTIKPIKGSVLVFPPTWQYPHRGCPVSLGSKYIMSTYLNYV
jgi:hypothetical protein